jgi:deoxyribose-phosphate aldolase
MADTTLTSIPRIDMTQVATPEQVSALEHHVSNEMLAGLIDHTNLFPWATHDEIIALCSEAHKYKTAAVCVNEGRIYDASEYLKEGEYLKEVDSAVKVCCVIGFPLGAATSAIKAFSAVDAVRIGADEVDMVINVGLLKDRNFNAFNEDIGNVMHNVARYNRENGTNAALKVIQENCYLTDEEVYTAASTTARLAGNYPELKVFAKTSTGFGTPAKGPVPKKSYGFTGDNENALVNTEVGANVYDVALMKKAIDDVTMSADGTYKYVVGIKAAGGIRDRKTALEMMCAAGCLRHDAESGLYTLRENYKALFRIGASATANILSGK